MTRAGKILILGGGFAGFWAAISARRVAPNAAITLVSRGPQLEIRPRLYEAHPEALGVDLRHHLSKVGVEFVQDEIVRLDTANKAVVLGSGVLLAYDRLVVATGSRMRRPPVPGAEAAYSVDTMAEAIVLDDRLAAIAREAANPCLVVVGAGFAGIELVLELRDRVAAHGAVEAAETMRVVLIDRADVIGPELGPGPRPEVEAAMKAARIEVRLSANIKNLAADYVGFYDGSVLAADAVVLATGMFASPFAAQIPGERDQLGRVVVGPTLRAGGAPDIYLAGDVAAANTGDGHRTLQSCQHAGQLGRVAGENAARDLLGLPLMNYEQSRYVTCLDLGRSGAVITQGWERKIDKTGSEGKAIKRLVNTQIIYPPKDGSAAALLAYSSTVLSERTRVMDSPKATP